MKNYPFLSMMILATSLWSLTAGAQAMRSMSLNIEAKNFVRNQSGDAQVDLLKELEKISAGLSRSPNLEIAMLKLEAKTGVGGAQIYLNINNSFMDGDVVETDPAPFSAGDARGYQRVELKNIERTQIRAASLYVTNFSNVLMKSYEVVLGNVAEPVVLGKYANEQSILVSQIGNPRVENPPVVIHRGSTTTTTRPYGPVVNPPTQPSRPAVRPPPVRPVTRPVVTTTTLRPVTRSVTDNNQCGRHPLGYNICVGDTVYNRFRSAGRVRGVSKQGADVLLRIEFDFNGGRMVERYIDEVQK